MNKTKCIDPSMLDGKEPIAVGYKIFNYDWTGYGGYSYADESGNVEGSVHTVTGNLSKCGWGLHYCVNPVDCMRYRDLIHWNKFALVEAYDENIECPEDGKSVCRTMRIKKVLTFDEMVDACKKFKKDGYGIRNGYGISDSSGINQSMHCNRCKGISRCIFCAGLEGAKLMIFNKPVNERRFGEVWNKLSGWQPNFTNAQELKDKYGGGEWKRTPITEIKSRDASEAYAEMPPHLIEYVKAMPEYDEEIFKAITGGGI